MRYSKEHKEETRRRVLEVAAARFRKDGLDGVGVAAVMSDAGLTHGGFYSHFPSKEALIEAVFESEPRETAREFLEISKAEGIEGFIRYYLRMEHVEHPESGCPAAALASEVVTVVEQTQPDLICITALPPGDLAHARYLCKRLRARFPQGRIFVVCPGLAKESKWNRQIIIHRLIENGAHMVATSTAEARTQIPQQLFPVVVQSSETKITPVCAKP